MEIDYVVMTTSFGGRDISEMKNNIPNLMICTDYNRDAMNNFLNSLIMTDKPSVHLEDDAELCNDFVEKIEAAIKQYPDKVINFFSLRKGDYLIGKPFEVTGAKFMATVCFYLPEGYGKEIVEFYKDWSRKEEHPTGYDILIADFLKSRKERYIQWFPHLTNHKICKSLINPKRSSQRTDKFFKK